jgi:excisionase family DNA binding protein
MQTTTTEGCHSGDRCIMEQTTTQGSVIVSPYLTATEAAAYLRTTIQGIYSLVKRGKIRALPGRPGRLLFVREELDAYVTGKRKRA